MNLKMSAQTGGTLIKESKINNFYTETELEKNNKNILILLYIERVTALTNILIYLPLTNNPNVSYADIDIVDNLENIKVIEKQKLNIEIYLKESVKFQQNIVPFASKKDIISSILFYEEIFKKIKTLKEE